MPPRDPANLMHLCPRLAVGVNWLTLALDPRDAYILSRIDGATPSAILADMLSISADSLFTTLRRLESIGVVLWPDDAPVEPARPLPVSELPAEAVAVIREQAILAAAAHPALAENCDLGRDDRVRILTMEYQLGRLSHWDLLGVEANASPGALKKAYFQASKAFHPDRYFGKSLGTFEARLEHIFQAVKRAYDTLADPATQAAYRVARPPAPPPPRRPAAAAPLPADSTAEQERLQRLEEHRKTIVAERKKSRTIAPEEARRRGQEMYALAAQQIKDGALDEAVLSLRKALGYVPASSAYRQLYEEISSQASIARAQRLVDQGELAAKAGHHGAAAKIFASAADLMPSQSGYAQRAAQALSRVGEHGPASRYLDRALMLSPKRIDLRLTAAEVLEAAGDRRGALDQLEVAASLDKHDAHVKNLMNRLLKT